MSLDATVAVVVATVSMYAAHPGPMLALGAATMLALAIVTHPVRTALAYRGRHR